jgi:hypothetical protein
MEWQRNPKYISPKKRKIVAALKKPAAVVKSLIQNIGKHVQHKIGFFHRRSLQRQEMVLRIIIIHSLNTLVKGLDS